jgi:hypothetical protein
MSYPENIDIIVARYNEDLSWTLEEPFNRFNYIVYNKGDNEDFEKKLVKKIINLPNVGRNDHTYMWHIVNNYEKLNDILVFLPGSVDMSYKKTKAITMLNKIINNNFQTAIFVGGRLNNNVLKEFYNFSLDKWGASYSQNFTKNNETELKKADIRPFGKWFLFNLGNINVKFIQFEGIFSVDKRDILKYKKFRYEKFVAQLETSSNPEVGHYIERSWSAILSPLLHTKIFLLQ